MNKTYKNADSTTMPGNKSLLPSFPGIVEETSGVPVKFGESEPLRFPISLTERVSIDPALMRGRGTLRLANIKQALKIAGKTNDADGRKWFNSEVRDPWHKVLKFATKQALEYGKPVSLGLSRRTAKKTGQVTLTSKHGFEYVEVPATEKAVADKAAKQSATRAKRQKRNRPMPGNSVGAAIEGATSRVDATAPESVPATA